MTAVGSTIFSILTLTGVALVMNINNSIAIGALTLRACNAREGLWMRLGGLAASLLVRLALVVLLAVSLRPEFEGLLGLRVPGNLQDLFCPIAGGFLLVNGAVEIMRRLRSTAAVAQPNDSSMKALSVLPGIALVAAADVSLSFDSLIAVAGMASHPAIMPAIVLVEVAVIALFAETVARMLRRYPTIETLAICALLLMGGAMVLRAAGHRVPDAVVYGMIGFALLVELLDMRIAAVAQVSPKRAATESSIR